jgi:protein associated with RNAse G/E
VDLDLDVYVRPDGHAEVLDADEFEFHRRHFAYPRGMVAGARRAAREIVALARAGLLPFDGSLAAFHRALYAPADHPDAR